MAEWTLTFPRTPSLNELMAWKANKAKRWKYAATRDAFVSAATSQRRAARAEPCQARRHVVVTRYSPKQLDQDGLAGGCKILLDALVRSGWLVDDSPEWLEVEFRQAKGRENKTVVEVCEVEL